ncbi:MAG: hypothetical protein JXA82_16555 [Sedimentisphaerales bacterium]|nr:hypothetical protein [Sedimentisphaerales bacterium]
MFRNTDTENDASDTVVLGLLSASHLGDVLCTTTIPRQLNVELRKQVFVVDHSSTRLVFANNPYVAGFVTQYPNQLKRYLRGGNGHVIQRLQQGLGVCVSTRPKPEIYLSDEEYAWAKEQKQYWPKGKPVCLLSTRLLSDKERLGDIDWETIGYNWADLCTIIQPVITKPEQYVREVASVSLGENIEEKTGWGSEAVYSKAYVYENLTTRQYIALFSVVDYFCGGTSGGANVAAAFNVPSLIIVWDDLNKTISFPSKAQSLSPGTFLYPQHQFFFCDQIKKGMIDVPRLKTAIMKTINNIQVNDRFVVFPPSRRQSSYILNCYCKFFNYM